MTKPIGPKIINALKGAIEGKTEADNGKPLVYDHATGKMVLSTPTGGDTTALETRLVSAESELGINQTEVPLITPSYDNSATSSNIFVGYDIKPNENIHISSIKYRNSQSTIMKLQVWNRTDSSLVFESELSFQTTEQTILVNLDLIKDNVYTIGQFTTLTTSYYKHYSIPPTVDSRVQYLGGRRHSSKTTPDLPIGSITSSYAFTTIVPIMGVTTLKSKVGNATQIQGKTVPAPTATDDEKVLAYDNDTNAFKFITPAAGGGGTIDSVARTELGLIDYGEIVTLTEDFEDDDMVFNFIGDWIRTSSNFYAGAYSFTNKDIGGNGISETLLSLNFVDAGQISFYYKTDSENSFDFLRFYIDGVEKLKVAGPGGAWTLFTSESIPVGLHTLKWTYSKDGSGDTGTDSVYIDQLVITGVERPPTVREMALSIPDIEYDIGINQTLVQTAFDINSVATINAIGSANGKLGYLFLAEESFTLSQIDAQNYGNLNVTMYLIDAESDAQTVIYSQALSLTAAMQRITLTTPQNIIGGKRYFLVFYYSGSSNNSKEASFSSVILNNKSCIKVLGGANESLGKLRLNPKLYYQIAPVTPYRRLSNMVDSLQNTQRARSIGFYLKGELSVENNAMSFFIPSNMQITSVKMSVDLNPTGSDLIIDFKVNGTSIYTTTANRPKIVAGSLTGTGVAPDLPYLTVGDKLTLDIIQVGSTIAGASLTASVMCKEI